MTKASFFTSLQWRCLLFSWMLAATCAAEPHESTAVGGPVAAQLDRFHKAAAHAEFEAYFSLFSKDGVFIGTDASERWSVEQFKQYVKPYFSQGKGWRYVPRDRTIVVRGDVAWFDELLDNDAYGECRGSGVLVREDEQWKIAQYNLHFPIPNDLAKQVTQMIKEAQSR